MKYNVDTNVLLRRLDALEGLDIVISAHVLRELEHHTKSNNPQLAWQARKAKRWIRDNNVKLDLIDYNFNLNQEFDPSYVDNKLIQMCVENNYGLITNDIILLAKAEGFEIPHIELKEDFVDDNPYEGILELRINADAEKYANMYDTSIYNPFDMVKNQYLLIWDDSKPNRKDWKAKHYMHFDGEKLRQIKPFDLQNKFTGHVKPRNVRQSMLFDLLQNDKITVKSCFGLYGSGKDYCMISHAMDFIMAGKFERLVWVRNNIELKDTEEIGFRKGDLFDKLIEFAMPLADHVGGIESLRDFVVNQGIIELQHLGTIRGRDIKNSIIYVTEFQNNTAEHTKLLLGRVGEDSQLWVNGDVDQIDRESFSYKNGIKAIKQLKGHELYGQVTLDKTERSKTAELSQLIVTG